MIKVTSVVRKARNLRYPIRNPLMLPKTKPANIAAARAAQMGQPKMKKLPTAAKVAKAKIEPTERSIPPPRTTTVRPTTTMENSPSWRVEPLRDSGLKNPGMAQPNPATVTTRARKGMALSVQRLVRISPIR